MALAKTKTFKEIQKKERKMDKPWEIITKEELRPIWETPHSIEEVTELINDVILDKGHVGNCRAGTIDFICGDIPKGNIRRNTDTHQALAFFRLLEEEKPKGCQHITGGYANQMEEKWVSYKFCPLCKEELS